jgi:hypothetical protein
MSITPSTPRLRFLLVATLVTVTTTAAAGAQPQLFAGDYILGDSGVGSRGIVHVDRFTRSVTTMMQLQGNQFMAGLTMSTWNNRDIESAVPAAMVGPTLEPPFLAKTSSNNVVTTFIKLPRSVIPVDVLYDQDGGWVVASSTGSVLKVFWTLQTTFIYGLPPTLKAITKDGDTGDYILGISGAGLLLRAKLGYYALSTIATGLGDVRDVDFDPETGNFVVATSTAPQVRMVSPTGRTVSTIRFPGIRALKVDPVMGTIHCASANEIAEFMPSGQRLNLYRCPGYDFTSLDLYASLPVSGGGTARRGSSYLLNLSFPQSGSGKSYYGALSFGLRPGVTIPGIGKVNLAPDALFTMSFYVGGVPGITYGLRGVLKQGGVGIVSVVLPRDCPIGLRVHASAIAMTGVPRQPIAVGNTWSFTVMP